jgi:hypothetical protein
VKPATLWPIAIVAVLALTVIGNVFVIVAANGRDAAVVEPDYYRKALAWDSTLAQRARDQDLGWRLDARLAPLGADGRARLEARLAGRDGAPIADARVHVVAVHNREARAPRTATLAPVAGGYAAELPLARAGLWELRFDVRRGGERFTATLRREAMPGTPAPALRRRDATMPPDGGGAR